MTPSNSSTHFIAMLVVVACSIAITNQPPLETCAANCTCTPEDTDWGYAVNVQCGGRNLTSVPISSNNKPVSVLNASHNFLQTLEENALHSYESVRYLYLQHCQIDNVSEKAFQKLENLTEIDLSSNLLTSVSPNLFNSNQKLDKLILRNNNLGSMQWNTPILKGPSSLSYLDLQSCQLSNISSITFSLLRNLTTLDISRNDLVLLNPDAFSSHQKLNKVNLKYNPWECGPMFKALMCWMHSKLALSHNTVVRCQKRNKTWDTWSHKKRSLLCDSDLTTTVTPLHNLDTSTSTNFNATTTSSHMLDIFKGKTLNPEVPLAEKPVNKSEILWWVVIILLLLLILLCIILVCMKYGAQLCERVRRALHLNGYQNVGTV
jgi:hypothetical protein